MRQMPGSFLDTNILLYNLSTDPRRSGRVEQLIRDGGTISVQVLNELANVAIRKMALGWDELQTYLETIRQLLAVVPLDLPTHVEGMRLCQRYNLPLYDGMIVSAAMLAGCDILWTEDMQHGLTIDDRLQIRNPFISPA